ncbi:MAG: hypothetical protein LIP01_13560 [Tannerellaceae bacterium]|nr:hypothetical protein [Tannerellaceae bacterium]
MILSEKLFSCFKDKVSFTLNEAYREHIDKPHETVRARIYDNLNVKFERIAKGVYKTIDADEACVIIEGDGRDLSMIRDESIDCILTDHPWLDLKSNRGGTRKLEQYYCFKYTQKRF